MKATLNNQDAKRVYQAITETTRLIMKEKSYSEDLQKKEYLKQLENHLANLFLMIERGSIL